MYVPDGLDFQLQSWRTDRSLRPVAARTAGFGALPPQWVCDRQMQVRFRLEEGRRSGETCPPIACFDSAFFTILICGFLGGAAGRLHVTFGVDIAQDPAIWTGVYTTPRRAGATAFPTPLQRMPPHDLSGG